ncbi:MAG: transglycosylase domain-containing protein [Candidatus Sungbacteria bacterium]|uniref:Transglycosylase domain-containing protein n=1 Tax=Candidatus Sungiibacteriota bacterium TaxID=2750080 RepID=A0A933DRN5_9BACT|nr:transglycosylase domain-containing protein [Candidatus Sungbacteria bacterium]
MRYPAAASRRRPAPKRFLRSVAFLLTALAVAGGVSAALILKDLPAPTDLFSRRVIQSTKIYDRSGAVLLYEIHGEEKRTVIPFSEIPAVAKNATIAVEDANFYRHGGIDLKGILRAFITDVLSGNLRQGGSTITQQLVKNALLGREQTLQRKIKEAILAIVLETRLDKDKILDLYLNQIPYGSNAYGIEAAAETFFGKHARDLSAAEAALLASLPRAPSYYSPYGQHKDELLARRNRTLARMEELGFLSAAETGAAKAETPRFLPATKNIRAPHFVMFVRDYLVARYGEEEVEQGGLSVTTTLDWKLQEAAEKTVVEYASRNESLIKAANMALTAIDPRTGEILAMVGSAGWLSDKLADPIPEGCQPGLTCRLDPYVNAALRPRQPGSAFKPFVYATAFKKGFAPETVLFDVPTEFNPRCGPDFLPRPGTTLGPEEDCYHPQNYDETFRGPVTLRQALAQSLNVPSVKLLYLAGVEDSIRTAEDLGITSLGARERFGLSLVLGGAEVQLLEMTSAFSALANDGVLNPPAAVLKVETASGRVLEEKRAAPRPVLDPHISRTVNNILSDNESRIPAFQPRSALYFPDAEVAVKTGTTQDYRDAWTVGYTPGIAVGVWTGNNDNSPMQQKGSGVMAAAPSWHAFLEFALQEFPPEPFPPPEPVETTKSILRGLWQGEAVVAVDAISGKRATDLTPPETRRDIAFGEPRDPLYWIDRSDPAGPPLQHPEEDPQYQNWDAAFRAWLERSGFAPRALSTVPEDYDDVHTAEKQPRLSVKKVPAPPGTVVIRVEAVAPFGLKEASLLIQDRVIASRTRPISPFEFAIPEEQITEGVDALEVRAYDTVGNIGSALVVVR